MTVSSLSFLTVWVPGQLTRSLACLVCPDSFSPSRSLLALRTGFSPLVTLCAAKRPEKSEGSKVPSSSEPDGADDEVGNGDENKMSDRKRSLQQVFDELSEEDAAQIQDDIDQVTGRKPKA
ncbi:MAG: hypothetical protein HWE23_01245 [Rhodobacteraceae bacterium]|nr:hypothetical protein [Paracoccaceae bacterium]